MARSVSSSGDRPSEPNAPLKRRPMADFLPDGGGLPLSPIELVRKEFATRLQRALQQRKWRQVDLACAAGIGRDSVNSYIRGRMLPGQDKLEKIAKALRMEPQELMPSRSKMLAERESPPLEIRQSSEGPGKVRIKVNQEMTLDQASRILDVLRGVPSVPLGDMSGAPTGAHKAQMSTKNDQQ